MNQVSWEVKEAEEAQRAAGERRAKALKVLQSLSGDSEAGVPLGGSHNYHDRQADRHRGTARELGLQGREDPELQGYQRATKRRSQLEQPVHGGNEN